MQKNHESDSYENDKNIRNNKNKKKSVPKGIESTAKETAAYETFALAGGERNPESGTTIPPEEGVAAARSFVEENKK